MDGPDEYIFSNVTDLATDHPGNLHVMDAGDAVIKVFDSAGEFLFQYGGKGEGPGEFRRPLMIEAAPDGRSLFVLDWGVSITQFDAEGNYIRRARFPDEVLWVNDFCVLNRGDLVLHEQTAGFESIRSWEEFRSRP